jgi:hypothetical protein
MGLTYHLCHSSPQAPPSFPISPGWWGDFPKKCLKWGAIPAIKITQTEQH